MLTQLDWDLDTLINYMDDIVIANVYDILITDSSGDKTRILEGHATVTPSVSRS